MSEMQRLQGRADLPDVISLDQLPDAPTVQPAAPDAIDINLLPDAQPAQPQASGMMEGLGSALVRGYQDTSVDFNLAEKFRLTEYKNSLERGGPIDENDEQVSVMRINQSLGKMPRDEQGIRAWEINRVNSKLAKLDELIKGSTATAANYQEKSAPYMALQQGIEQARKSTTPVRDFAGTAWENIAGVPELLAEGAYATGRPIAAAIGAGLALRRGQAPKAIQTLGPIAASMGLTGIDSYRSTISETIKQKALEGGIDLRKNPELLGPLLTDADFIEAVKSDALKAGVNDAAWAGISTALGMSPRIKGVWQPITQAGAEGLTEVSNKIVRGKPVSSVDTGVALLTGAAFEAPGYGIGRAVGAFSPSTPATATPAAQTQPQAQPASAAQTQAAPDVIDIDTLPVAGETATSTPPVIQAQPVAQTPAPTQPAPAQPTQPAAEQPAPAQDSNVPPRPVLGLDENVATAAQKWEWIDASRAWDAKYGKTHNADGTPKGTQPASQAPAQQPAPSPVQPAAEQPAPVEQPAPAPAEQPRATAAELQEQLNQANAREEAAGAALDVAIAKWRKLFDASQQDPENQELAAAANEASEAAVVATDAWRATQRDVESARSLLESETARAGLEAASAPANPAQPAAPAQSGLDRLLAEFLARQKSGGQNQERPLTTDGAELATTEPASSPAAVQPATTKDTPQTEAASAAPVKPSAPAKPTTIQQAELGGTEGAFNLAGEQVAAPAEPVQAPTELGVERENPIVSEARARLMKLEAAGRGDSEQAAALRRTIERESKPAAPADNTTPQSPQANPDPQSNQDEDGEDEGEGQVVIPPGAQRRKVPTLAQAEKDKAQLAKLEKSGNGNSEEANKLRNKIEEDRKDRVDNIRMGDKRDLWSIAIDFMEETMATKEEDASKSDQIVMRKSGSDYLSRVRDAVKRMHENGATRDEVEAALKNQLNHHADGRLVREGMDAFDRLSGRPAAAQPTQAKSANASGQPKDDRVSRVEAYRAEVEATEINGKKKTVMLKETAIGGKEVQVDATVFGDIALSSRMKIELGGTKYRISSVDGGHIIADNLSRDDARTLIKAIINSGMDVGGKSSSQAEVKSIIDKVRQLKKSALVELSSADGRTVEPPAGWQPKGSQQQTESPQTQVPEQAEPKKKIEFAPEFRQPKMPEADKKLLEEADKDKGNKEKQEAARAAMNRFRKRVAEAQKKHDEALAAWRKRNGLDDESTAKRQAEIAALRAEVEAKQPPVQQTQETKPAQTPAAEQPKRKDPGSIAKAREALKSMEEEGSGNTPLAKYFQEKLSKWDGASDAERNSILISEAEETLKETAKDQKKVKNGSFDYGAFRPSEIDALINETPNEVIKQLIDDGVPISDIRAIISKPEYKGLNIDRSLLVDESTQAQKPAAAPAQPQAVQQGDLPADATGTVDKVKELSGAKLSDAAASEIEIHAEEGLQPDFVEEAEIKNLKDHLEDLLERLETSLDAARTSGRDGATPAEQRKAVSAAKGAIDAVKAAIAKLDGKDQQAAQPQAQPATQTKSDPSIDEAAKAQKTDQPQTKRARTALRNAIREFGRDDTRTKKKYRAVLDALEREAYREKSARDISQPYLGRKEPADVTAARQLLAKKAKATGGISGYDIAKANALIEQYEAEVDLSQGQLRDNDQIRLVSDETLDRVIAHVQGMIDEGKNPDADARNAFDLATEERQRRENESTEGYGDPIADVRSIARKSSKAVGIPLLPAVRTERGETAFAGTEYSALAESLPPELSKEGGLFVEPDGGVDVERAKKDGDYRNKLRIAAEGMIEKLGMRMVELGWTQLEGNPMGVIQLLQDAAMGRPQIPEGGVAGASFKGDPNTVAKAHSGDIDLSTLGSEGQVNADEEVDTREPEPSDEDKQTALDMEVEYEDPRYDSQPSPEEQAILDAAADGAPSEQSMLDALDKAAREALDPKNLNEIFTAPPRIIAAVTWMTARQIQKGVVNFAKWSADTARKFPSLKGSLKAIWARAQDIAKRPMDYIRFRALDSIADKVWQNARRNKGSATLRKIANIVFAKAGPDADATENDIPTRINLVRNQFSNIYAGIMERFAAEFADMTPEQRRQWDADFRKAVIEGTTPSDPKVAKAVQDFRNLMKAMLAYQRDAGITMGDQGGTYFPRSYDPDAVEANRDGFVAAAVEMYRKRDARILAANIDRIKKSVEARALERKEADKKFGRKIKSDAEYRADALAWADEKINELQDEHDAKDDEYYQQKAEDWATAITHGDVLGLTLFKATEGKVTSDATDARTFNNDEAALADEFLKKNVDDIMLGYIDGAVRGAELARVFGEDGKKFEQMMNQLSREGVDKETVKETARLVQKALGVGREQSSKASAAFFDWVNVVLASAFLGKTFVYNLVLEPISFGIRTGNVYLAIKGMVDTWRYTLEEIAKPSPEMRQRIEAKYGSQKAFAKAVTEIIGEQVGLIQNEMERSYFNAHWDYSSDEKGSRMAKWLSQRIYRANLMSATEKAKVQASIGIARLALRDNARFFTGDAPIQKLFASLGMDTNADKSAAAIMRENGVPDRDHKAFAVWVAGLEGKTDAEWRRAVMDPQDPMAKHYRRALQRMSLGMSIKTNPALKMEMSDSVLGRMLMQLMNYSYAYSNLVKDRMYSMATATAAKDASKIDRLRYAAPLVVGAPLAIMGAIASKALIAKMWPSDEEEERRKKISATRKAFDSASFAGMFGPKAEYLFKSFERGQMPGGPLADIIFRGGQAAFASAGDPESDKKFYNLKKQAYGPAVKTTVTGAGSAAHPFFGFLGNAAVNSQDVRESVIGQPPRR